MEESREDSRRSIHSSHDIHYRNAHFERALCWSSDAHEPTKRNRVKQRRERARERKNVNYIERGEQSKEERRYHTHQLLV